MGLLFVRHGQARAGTEDYDRLSTLGQQQALRLGQWLQRHHPRIAAVRIGGMRRHQQTWEGIAQAFADQGVALPEPLVDQDLNEFDHHAVFDGFAAQNPDHPALLEMKRGGLKAFGAMIHAALLAWSRDEIEGVPERWSEFGARAARAADSSQADGDALLVTSGGVISRIAQHAMSLQDRAAVDLNLSLRNSGLCEFHARPYGLALGSWNALPHLHDAPELWTYY